MTVLGAVVFGGFLALGVLWLLVTAPESDVDKRGINPHGLTARNRPARY